MLTKTSLIIQQISMKLGFNAILFNLGKLWTWLTFTNIRLFYILTDIYWYQTISYRDWYLLILMSDSHLLVSGNRWISFRTHDFTSWCLASAILNSLGSHSLGHSLDKDTSFIEVDSIVLAVQGKLLHKSYKDHTSHAHNTYIFT